MLESSLTREAGIKARFLVIFINYRPSFLIVNVLFTLLPPWKKRG